MKYLFTSINTTLIFSIFLSLLLPISVAIWYTTHITQKQLYSNFANFRQLTTKNIATALSDPLYYFLPNNGGLVIETLKHDPRVVKIEVYDTFNEIDFLEFSAPKRENDTFFVNREYILKNNDIIGYIEITYNDSSLRSHIKAQKNFFLQIFGLMFLILFAVLVPVIYFKLLAPLRKLTRQAQQLRDHQLEESFTWSGRDEINLLGQSFELARINMLNHVNELKRVSETDRLTKLFNRHKTDAVLVYEQNRSERFEHTFGMLLIDVDNFKLINDKYGHQIGDHVLKDIAKILKDNSRDVDTVGRWGGEEFMIICPESNEEGLVACATKILNLVYASTFEIDETQTVSIGATLYQKGEKLSEMISRADKALYKAKTTGKNKVIFV